MVCTLLAGESRTIVPSPGTSPRAPSPGCRTRSLHARDGAGAPAILQRSRVTAPPGVFSPRRPSALPHRRDSSRRARCGRGAAPETRGAPLAHPDPAACLPVAQLCRRYLPRRRGWVAITRFPQPAAGGLFRRPPPIVRRRDRRRADGDQRVFGNHDELRRGSEFHHARGQPIAETAFI